MAERKPSPPPFSVILAETEAKLHALLTVAQYVASTKSSEHSYLVLSEEFENKIKVLCAETKVLRALILQRWRQAYTCECKNMIERHQEKYDKNVYSFGVTTELAHLAADLATLATFAYVRGYCIKHDTFCIEPYGVEKQFSIAAKHLPIPQPGKTEKVTLADGNVAWLTPETLKTVREIIANK